MNGTTPFALALSFSLLPAAAQASTVPWSFTAEFTPGQVPVVGGVPGVGATLTPHMGSGTGSQLNTSVGHFWGSYNLAPDDPLFGQVFDIDPNNNQFTLDIRFSEGVTGDEVLLSSLWQVSGTVSWDNPAGVSVAPLTPISWTPVLNGQVFNVSLFSVDPTMPLPGVYLEGEIIMDVYVEDADPGGGTPKDNPEPASLVLMGLGICALGGRSGRRLLTRGK